MCIIIEWVHSLPFMRHHPSHTSAEKTKTLFPSRRFLLGLQSHLSAAARLLDVKIKLRLCCRSNRNVVMSAGLPANPLYVRGPFAPLAVPKQCCATAYLVNACSGIPESCRNTSGRFAKGVKCTVRNFFYIYLYNYFCLYVRQEIDEFIYFSTLLSSKDNIILILP